MIKSIDLEDFKAFQKLDKVDLKKINILVGPNSSGKSSYIKAITMLKYLIEHRKADEEIFFGADNEVGSFRSMVYNHQKTMSYSFNFTKPKDKMINETKNESQRETAFKIIYYLWKKQTQKDCLLSIDEVLELFERENSKHILKRVTIVLTETKSKNVVVDKFIVDFYDGVFVEIYRSRNSYYIRVDEINIETPNIIQFKGINAQLYSTKLSELRVKELEKLTIVEYSLFLFYKEIEKFVKGIMHLKPLRSELSRAEYIANLNSSIHVGDRGENTIRAILNINRNEGYEGVQREINFWINEFDLGKQVEIKRVGQNNYALNIVNKKMGIENNILDVGVGTTQLLPIIIESLISSQANLLIIEEPETHIHPNAQSKLADLFMECAKNKGKSFIIETHSIFLISKLQVLIAKKKLNIEDVGIYYFDQNENGTKVKEMRIMPNGQFEDEWPKGFFDVQYILATELYEHM